MLCAGAAVLDITPPLGVPLAGSFNARFAADVDDPLFARAVVLEDERGPDGRLAVVACDLICMPGETVRAARELIARAGHVPAERIMIAATHTHTAPSPAGLLGTPRADAYMDALPGRLATAVGMAAQRLRPARAAWGSGHESGVIFNRRFRLRDGTVRMNPGRLNPEIVGPVGPIDPQLGVLWLEDEAGAPLALISNFTLHYIGTDHGDHVSADYFGAYAGWMQRIYGPQLVPLLLNGAQGDINGVDVHDPDQGSGARLARRVAGIVAGETLRVVERRRPVAEVPLGAASARFSVPRKGITPDDLEVAARLLALPETVPAAELRQRAGLGPSGPFSWVVGQPLPDNALRLYARECQYLAALPEQLQTEVQALRIGGCAMVSLPGEPFVELGLTIKARSPFAPQGKATPSPASPGGPAAPGSAGQGQGVTFVVGLANDYVGYIGTRRAIAEEGSYETWAARSSLPAAGAGETMVDVAASLLERLASA
jgi:neutral ceramidase